MRQREVIILAGAGRKNREIAVLMDISERTVIQYMDRAFKTLDVHSRKEAFRKLQQLEK